MRIAVFHDLPSGGAKRALYEICRALLGYGHEIDLFMPDTANEAFLPLDDVVSAKHVFHVTGARTGEPPQPAEWTVPAWFMTKRCHRTIARAINTGGYDVAFVQHGRYPNIPDVLRYLTVPSALYCQEPNRLLYESPIHAPEWGLDARQASGLKDRLRLNTTLRQGIFSFLHRRKRDQANIAHATTVFANSYFSKESILRTFGVDAVVQYLGVNTEFFRPMDLQRENRIMSIGAIHPSKGYRFLLASVARIETARRPGVLIVGDREKPGERDALTRMAAEADIDLTIQTVDEDALVTAYNSVRAVVTVPYLEPFGFTPLEAMACATPVVGIREGGVRETVVDGKTGFLVDRDPQACADALDSLLSDDERRDRLGVEGRRIVETQWTWDRTGRRIEQAFERLMGS